MDSLRVRIDDDAFYHLKDRAIAAIADIAKDCGDKYQAQMGPQGDPVCVAIPQATKEKAKP